MAEAFQGRGDLADALRYYTGALKLAEEIQNSTIEAFALGSLGNLSRDRGNYAEAIAYFNRALAIGEQTGEVQARLGSSGGARLDLQEARSSDEGDNALRSKPSRFTTRCGRVSPSNLWEARF